MRQERMMKDVLKEILVGLIVEIAADLFGLLLEYLGGSRW